MKPYVIDASVALKWVFEETYQVEAETYLTAPYELIAPDIF